MSNPGMSTLTFHNFRLVKDRDFLSEPRKEGKKIVLFFGMSKVSSALIPELFDKEVGGNIYSYNLSTPALSIDTGYYVLKKYLQNHPAPEFIVIRDQGVEGRHDMFGNPHWEGAAAMGADMADIFERAIIAKNTNIMLSYFLPSRRWFKRIHLIQTIERRTKKIWEYAVRYREQHDKWPPAGLILPKLKSLRDAIIASLKECHKKRYNKRIDMWTSTRGWHDFTRTKIEKRSDPTKKLYNELIDQRTDEKYSEKRELELYDTLPEIHNPYVYKLFDLAKQHNIKILLVGDMTSFEGKELFIWRQNINNKTEIFWRSLQEKYDNIYFTENGYKVKFYERDCFADFSAAGGHHLNRKGAEKYTKEIAREFKSTFKEY